MSLVTNEALGQVKIGDNPQTIDPASVLELESNSKVLVITKATTAQMETIAPQRGGMVYNTDTECIHYFDGTQWVNLCDAVSFNITNDPIENLRSTIAITQTPNSYNLEVAPNSIRSEQIVDESINGVDLQDNSIGRNKLGDAAVGPEELATESVDSDAIIDGTIQTRDFAADIPDQLLTTDPNGIVAWQDQNDIYELSFSKADTTLTIRPSTGLGNNMVNLGALIGSDDQAIEVFNFNSGNGQLTLTLEDGGTETVNLGGLSTVEVDGIIGNEITDATDATLIRAGAGNAANPYTLDVAPLGIGTAELANNSVNNAKLANNAVQSVNIANGTVATIDIAPSAPAPANTQILSTNTAGVVEWIDVPEGAAEIDGIIGNEVSAVADATLTLTGVGTAGDPLTIDVAPLGIGTAELANNSVNNAKLANDAVQSANILDGTIATGDIAPAAATPANTQVLTTSTAGIVGWIDLPTGGTGTTELADQATITGDGTLGNEFTVGTIGSAQITNATILLEDLGQNGAGDGQVLKWNNTLGEWQPANDNNGGGTGISDTDANDGLSNFSVTTGYNINVDGTTIELATDALQIADDGVDATKINADVAGNGLNQNASGALEITPGTAEDQILKWNNTSGTWELDTDVAGSAVTDTDTNDGLSDFNATTGYDLKVDGTTIELNADVLRINDNGVDATKINPDVAGNGLNQNASGALEIIPGTAEDQILKWNNTSGTWELDTDVAGSAVTDTDTNDGLSDFNATTGYDINVDNTTIAVNATDQLEVPDDAITADKINGNVVGNGLNQNASGSLEIIPGTAEDQILKWNNTSGTWELDTDVAGSAVNDTDTNDGLSDFNPTTGYDLKVDGTTIETVADELRVKGSATDGQVLTTLGGVATWENLTNPVNTGAILFSDGNGGVNENVAQLNWDGNSLGIGVASPTAQLQVANQIRAGSFSGPDTGGSAALPTYRFNSTTKNDGMFQPGEDEIAFSAGGNEGLRILGNGNVGIGVTVPQQNLHVAGNIRTDGSFLSNDNIIGVPDYVFQKYFLGVSNLNSEYQFQSLKEIESFIKKNNHLPGVTSAKTAKKEGAWNLSKSNLQNLEKIEELFLHTIEQEKKIETLQEENKALSRELDALKEQVKAIQHLLAKENE
ncbi:hypothetical protein CJ263_13880 [Maribacter cobaltidurans]|uniref:Peptidase S74 domain-containing protein n=1 Tax=Maribacter cobaltidurans TaxID=1178778 RepID=A0A223V725_9FLAO|nr:hypothetical protein CJ263_13880 [Maribacter cobaltidurans]